MSLPILDDDALGPVIAPPFALKDLNGDTHSLSDYRGKWVLLNFWQTTCVPCVEEMPVFQTLADDMPELIVLAVNIREPVSVIEPFVEALGITYTILLSESNVSQDYVVLALPQ
ncbi:MAG: TlpA disulfide reductase family protein, partial [Chloroflexota bacterium]